MEEIGYSFCPSCGNRIRKVTKDSLPQVCSHCGIEHFHPPAPTVVGLVVVYVDRGRVDDYGLLCVHRRRPSADLPIRKALPGGYQHRGETLEDAISRELQEETNTYLPSSVWRYAGSSWSTSENESLIFFCARRPIISWAEVRDDFSPNNEVEAVDVLWFSKIAEEGRTNPLLSFSTHESFARWFVTKGFHDESSVYMDCRP